MRSKLRLAMSLGIGLMMLSGCGKVPTFQELVGGDEEGAKVVTKDETQTPPAEQTPETSNIKPSTPQVSPEDVVAEFRKLKPGQIEDGHLRKLGALDPEYLGEFQELNIEGSKVTDGGLSQLEKFPNLQALKADRTAISAVGMDAISRVQTLETLSIRDMPHHSLRMPTFDPAMTALSNMPGLKSLDLTNTKLTNSGLAPLTGLRSLERLILDDTDVGDAGLAHVESLVNLKEIRMSRTRITDQGFAHFAPLTSLEVVWAGRCGLNGSGFQVFGGPRSGLKSVNVSYNPFVDVGFQAILRIPTLESLMLSGTGLNDNGLLAIAKLPRIKHLVVGDNPITDPGVARLKSLRDLEVLEMGKAHRVSNAGIEPLAMLPKLQELNVLETSCTRNLGDLLNGAREKRKLPRVLVKTD